MSEALYTVQFVSKRNFSMQPYHHSMCLENVKRLVKFINHHPNMYEVGCDNITITKQDRYTWQKLIIK